MLSYSHGSWFAVAAPAGAALLSAELPVAAARAAWSEMRSGEGLAAVLDGVVGSFGTSLRSLPSFGVVVWDAATGSARVLVRGPVVVDVVSATGEVERFSGEGVTTWSERSVESPATVTLTVVAGEAPVSDGGEDALPLGDGIARAGALTWSADAVVPSLPPAPVIAPPVPVPPVPPAPESVPALEPEPVSPAVPPAPVVSLPAPPTAPVPDPVPPLPVPDPPLPVPPPVPLPAPGVPPAAAPVVPSPPAPDETLAPDPGLTYAPAPVAPAPVSDFTVGYDDFLYGETSMSSVEDAAVRAAPDAEASPGLISGMPSAAAAAAEAVDDGDHDGETISGERFAELQALLADAGGASSGLGAPPSGRADPVLIVSTGERVVLDRGVIVGRRPRAVRATGAVPHLVTVPSPNQDVSRSHVELRARGRDILAVDLDTTNGTRLLRAGADPVRLHPGEPALLVEGDRLDLGEGIVLAFEGLG